MVCRACQNNYNLPRTITMIVRNYGVASALVRGFCAGIRTRCHYLTSTGP
jgi:hypothetical protein